MQLIFLFSAIFAIAASVDPIDPDEKYNFSELIFSRGYKLQTYKVTTKDGYINTVYRVVSKDFTNNSVYCKNRKPVIVNHGLGNSATDFFITNHQLHPKNSSRCGDNFGFCLVDTGRYDIFLNNNRGNGHSYQHVNMTTNSPGFWHFSFDQMAKFDLPAVIDLVANITGHKTAGYIGHSQSGAIMFGLLSDYPEYSEKIKPFISWAPAVIVPHMSSPMLKLAIPLLDYYRSEGKMMNLSALMSLFTGNGSLSCHYGQADAACAKALTDLAGPSNHIDHHRLAVYLHFFPTPVSQWQLVHFGQNYLSGKFNHFNYGSAAANKAAYGTEHVPEYPLTKISPKMKIVVAYGETDTLTTPTDIHTLVNTLKPTLKENIIEYRVPTDKFNHMDFVIGTGAGHLLYDQTISWLDKLS